MKTLSAKKYADTIIERYGGGKKKALKLVNEVIEDLSKDGFASSNYHQIKFYLNVIKRLK